MRSLPVHLPPRRHAGVLCRLCRDDGAVSLQLAVIVPGLMFVILLVVQAALWMHAEHIAQAAASRALAAARADGASAGDGQARAEATLGALGDHLLQDPRVVVTRTGSEVRVRVTGRGTALIPGLTVTITATAHGPVDRFTAPTGGPR